MVGSGPGELRWDLNGGDRPTQRQGQPVNRRGSYRSRGGPDVGVSNVVGFVLITGISLLTISVVLLGGAPTLERVQSGQEVQSMTHAMNGLSEEVSTLVTGSPESTTPSWRTAFSRGTVSLNQTGHVWGYAVDNHEDHRIDWGSLHNGDGTIEAYLASPSSVASPSATVSTYDGAKKTELGTAGFADGSSWADGETRTIDLVKGISDDDIDGIEVTVKDGSTVIAKAFFFDTGAVIYSNAAGSQVQEVAYENSGVMVRQDQGVVLRNTPALRPPQETGTDKDPKRSVFFRVISLDGSASSGGQTSVTLLLDSGGNHARYSQADVERVQIYPAARYVDGWHRLLTDEVAGFPYTADCSLAGSGTAPDCTSAGSATYLSCDKDGADSCDVDDGDLEALSVSLVHTIVTVEED